MTATHDRAAGCTEKAVKAAIAARQWQKASHVVELLDEETGQEHVHALAAHYAAVHEYKSAEKFFLRSRNPKAAIDMFIQAGMWDDAHRLSVRYMNPDDVADLYISKAEELEQSNKYVRPSACHPSVGLPSVVRPSACPPLPPPRGRPQTHRRSPSVTMS